MANKYKDENGHWTTKENDGGPCHHDTNGDPIEGSKVFDEEYGEDEEFDGSYNEEFEEYEEDEDYFDSDPDHYDSDVEYLIARMKYDGVDVTNRNEVDKYLEVQVGLDREDRDEVMDEMNFSSKDKVKRKLNDIGSKKYSIGSDKVLEGAERRKMQLLTDALKKEGLNASLQDGWEDYGARMSWTAPAITRGGVDVWAINPKTWIDYMNGDKSLDEVINELKTGEYTKKWFENKTNNPSQKQFNNTRYIRKGPNGQPQMKIGDDEPEENNNYAKGFENLLKLIPDNQKEEAKKIIDQIKKDKYN